MRNCYQTLTNYLDNKDWQSFCVNITHEKLILQENYIQKIKYEGTNFEWPTKILF